MSGLKVLVVGASIAGPATAYWLAKAGAKVTVIERFAELRRGGQAVDIRTAGVFVMRKMIGMEAQVRARSTKEEGVSFVGADGRLLGTIRATGNPDQQSLVSEYEIFRGDLAKILFDLTKDNKNVNYVFNEHITSMQLSETEDGPVKVEFANGLAASQYDLVVACDGATSRTRAMGLGCSPRDHVYSSNIWTAYFSAKQDFLSGSRIGQGYSAVGGRFVSVSTDPAGFSRIMLMAIHARGRSDAMLPFRVALSQGEEGLKAYIAEHYRGAGWKTDLFLQEMVNADDFYASEIVQVKLPRIHKDRFVLVGDAGYAAGPTGGGTSLALTGAYILAGEIARHPGNLAAGLEGYSRQMTPIIKEMQKIPPFVSTIAAPQTAWGIWSRNSIFALVTRSGLVEFASKYLANAFSSTDKFPLPEYQWKN